MSEPFYYPWFRAIPAVVWYILPAYVVVALYTAGRIVRDHCQGSVDFDSEAAAVFFGAMFWPLLAIARLPITRATGRAAKRASLTLGGLLVVLATAPYRLGVRQRKEKPELPRATAREVQP